MSEVKVSDPLHAVIDMPRLEAVRTHPLVLDAFKRLSELEQNRIYCRHGLDHSLDVARIAYIYALERGLHFSRELIYCAAILHDLGRVEEYETGCDHAQASCERAALVLGDTKGFSLDEQRLILEAIARHRNHAVTHSTFAALLHEADKRSRACFDCPARATCKWPDEKKNQSIMR